MASSAFPSTRTPYYGSEIKRVNSLMSAPEKEILLEKLICGVTEHRLEAYGTLTPLRGRVGYVVHPAERPFETSLNRPTSHHVSPLLLWQQWKSNTFILQQAAIHGTGEENAD